MHTMPETDFTDSTNGCCGETLTKSDGGSVRPRATLATVQKLKQEEDRRLETHEGILPGLCLPSSTTPGRKIGHQLSTHVLLHGSMQSPRREVRPTATAATPQTCSEQTRIGRPSQGDTTLFRRRPHALKVENTDGGTQTMHLRTTGGAARMARRPTDVAGEDVELYIALLEENELLHRQVGEMKMFFKDHGLTWVGTGAPLPNPLENQEPLEEKAPVDLGRIMGKIQELNTELSLEGRRRVVGIRGGHGAEFRATSSLHLVFYKDGIVVNNCDVRPYSDHATKSFVADLRDGFFPSELKEAYPDGLYIHAIDQSSTESASRCLQARRESSTLSFSGEGFRLGGCLHGRDRRKQAMKHVQNTGHESAPLQPLPKVDDGRQRRLPSLTGAGTNRQAQHETAHCRTKQATVRVRIPPTDHPMELRMDFQDTLEDLWHRVAHGILDHLSVERTQPTNLRKYFGGEALSVLRRAIVSHEVVSDFELRLPYPKREGPLKSLGQTLEESGLTPNAVVVFQRSEESLK